MKIATVGLPCQIEALRKLELFRDVEDFSWINDVYLKIGLFCRENWMYGCFRALIEDDYGIDMSGIEKFRIRKGNIQVIKDGKVFAKIPLEKAKPYIRVACFVCFDFSSELSDISIGAVGAVKKGYNIVIVRTRRGYEIINGAIEAGYIERINEIKRDVFVKVAKDKIESNKKEVKYREASGYDVIHIKTFDLSKEETYKISRDKSFDDLYKEVVDNGNCCSCGNCIAVCENLIMKDAFPEKIKECEDNCYKCYLSCPRAILPKKELERMIFDSNAKYEEFFGKYIEIYSARARDENIRKISQDGGTVTALLSYCLDYGIVDAVINVMRNERWEPIIKVSRKSEELLNTTKTIYSYAILSPKIKSFIRGGKID